MINLKLAQYNKKGEFEKFLELGKDFTYGGFQILLNPHKIMSDKNLPILTWKHCFLDEKDPFNRFDGRFNNRSYGDGKFVLVEYKTFALGELTMSQDDIFTYNQYTQKACSFDSFHYWQETEDAYNVDKECGYGKFKILGNIHENPELWSK